MTSSNRTCRRRTPILSIGYPGQLPDLLLDCRIVLMDLGNAAPLRPQASDLSDTVDVVAVLLQTLGTYNARKWALDDPAPAVAAQLLLHHVDRTDGPCGC